ncbi:50S ribosome-binding GTPase [Candidatus Woesearchaeota archaeon]|nr:50S ribosome-binding GTPase [Candidatus Woesearchaeota archaeon]
MPSFWRHVNKVLEYSNIIIEVLDARMIEETRNREIEDKIERLGKKILYVITKCDLVDIKKLEEEKKRLRPSVFISSTEKLGTTILKKKILELSHGESVTVGVVGYPNVGKSSLINALSGKGSARTSAQSGFTRGLQKIRVDSKILLLDTPGVLPNKEDNDFKHAKIGAVDYGKIKDPETAALKLIEEKKELILKRYGLADGELENILEEFAFKMNKIAKKGKADLDGAARLLLKEWQTGKMK